MLHKNMNDLLCNCVSFSSKQSGDIGLELEIEGKNLLTENYGAWQVKPENSLRNDPETGLMGYEYITKNARRFTTLEKDLTELFAKMGNAEILPSHRTSIHIHLNFQNNTWKDIFAFTLLFIFCEQIILRKCGAHRNGNLFCLSAYDTGSFPTTVEQWAYGVVHHYYRSFNDGTYARKYSNLNTDPLITQGSLEVRCFPLVAQQNKILTWAQWLMNIKRIAVSWPDESLRTLMTTCYQDPYRLLTDVFGHLNWYLVCQPNNPRELIDISIETVYEVYRAMLPVLEWTPSNQVEPPKRKKRNTFVNLEPAMEVGF